MAQIRQFERGEIIFSETSSGAGVYIVTSGVISIYQDRDAELVP